MMEFITEAFRSLAALNEDLFDTSAEGTQELDNTLNVTDSDETVRVIDPDAETYDDVNDAYVGKVIVDCRVCHSHIFKNKEDITISEEGEVNIDEQCPYCGEQEGFVVVGEITKYPAEKPSAEELVDAEDSATSDPVPEVETTTVEESYVTNNRKFISRKVVSESRITISKDELAKLDKAVEDARKEVIKYPIKEKQTSTGDVEPDFSEVNDNDLEAAKVAYYNYKKAVKAAPDRMKDELIVHENLTEGVNNVNVETDDSIVNVATEENGKVTVTTEPKTAEAAIDSEVIAPLADETVDEIINANEEPVEENDEMTEVDFDIEEVDEEAVNELGESYLKNVYENVESFTTTSVSSKNDKMIIEGLIKFKSGTEKKTGFIFEAKAATKTGKVKFIGENKHLCRGNKAFTLTGKVEGSKLIAESFTYNYRAKNAEGKPTKVYGTVRTSRA